MKEQMVWYWAGPTLRLAAFDNQGDDHRLHSLPAKRLVLRGFHQFTISNRGCWNAISGLQIVRMELTHHLRWFYDTPYAQPSL
jgi:hypothetical protein